MKLVMTTKMNKKNNFEKLVWTVNKKIYLFETNPLRHFGEKENDFNYMLRINSILEMIG